MSMATIDPPIVRFGRFLRDNPVIPLIAFLVLLIGGA